MVNKPNMKSKAIKYYYTCDIEYKEFNVYKKMGKEWILLESNELFPALGFEASIKELKTYIEKHKYKDVIRELWTEDRFNKWLVEHL